MATGNDSKKRRRAAGETKVTARDALAMLQSAAHYAVDAGLNLRSWTQAADSGDTLVIVVQGARQAIGADGLTRFELAAPADAQNETHRTPKKEAAATAAAVQQQAA